MKTASQGHPREVLPCDLTSRNLFKTDTVAYKCSQLVLDKLFIIMAKLANARDLKSAELRVLEVRLPPPGTKIIRGRDSALCIPCMVSDTVLSSHARSEFCT